MRGPPLPHRQHGAPWTPEQARCEAKRILGEVAAGRDSKTGGKTIHLNAPALDVLAGLPRLDGNPFIICGGKPGARLGDLEAPWRRVRKAALLDDVRLHDLRHSFASIAVAGGMSLPLVGALLGHSEPQTTARYCHWAADPLKAAAELVGSKIAAAMTGGAKASVAKLPTKR